MEISDNKLCELLLGRINDKNDQIDLLNKGIDAKDEYIKELQGKLEVHENKNKNVRFSFNVTEKELNKILDWARTHAHESDEPRYVTYQFRFNGGGHRDYVGSVVCDCGEDFCFRNKLDAALDSSGGDN